ncbi:MAG: PaaI family thioesterase [Actinomyces sp.]|nr:MAG: PaaI family thioesterase [Actinomyces sp.]
MAAAPPDANRARVRHGGPDRRASGAVTEPALTPDLVNATIAELWGATRHRCVEVSPTHAVASVEIDQTNLRPGGYVSGPTQFGLVDAALWYLTFGALDRVEPMALTSELSIRFLRPAVGRVLWARAELDRAGRTAVVGTVRCWMDDAHDRPVSTAQGTYTLPRP